MKEIGVEAYHLEQERKLEILKCLLEHYNDGRRKTVTFRLHYFYLASFMNGIYLFYQYAVMIEAPKNIRLQRVKNRSFQKFDNRMLLGGNLYEQEKEFLLWLNPAQRVKLKGGCML